MPRSRQLRRFAVTTVVAMSLLAALAPPAWAAPTRLSEAQSVSSHRVLADYNQTMDTASKKASNYTLTGPNGETLQVVAVTPLSARQALITTAAQQAVAYSLKGPPAASAPVSFTGSTTAEPVVTGAVALDSTHVQLSFSAPMTSSARTVSNYSITQGTTTTRLRVKAAATSTDLTRVTLTTAVQAAVQYRVAVKDIKAANGIWLDPTANSAGFDGVTTSAGATGSGPNLSATARREGATGVLLTFDKAMSPSAADPANYTTSPDLFVTGATLTGNNRQVLLATGPHFAVPYTITAKPAVTDLQARPVNPSSSTARFTGVIAVNSERPTVTSAISTGNTKVLIQFSKPMADTAVLANRYVITQENVNPEVGTVAVQSVRFLDGDRKDVELTTASQNEVTYRVSVSNLTDLAGNPLADRRLVNGVLIDPRSATFPGTPPTGSERVDTDGDGLFDHEEALGWQVNIRLTNGEQTTRQVTSNPATGDTDGDGLPDSQEKTLIIDPRDDDTDDDGLGDFAEFNEIFSDPTNQDSDSDSLYDGLEVNFFRTSSTLADTDGDQIPDGVEINLAKRNPKVADLPKPALELTGMNMELDVRFTEATSTQTRVLEERTASSTLTQSDRQEFSSTDERTIQAGTKLTQEVGVETKVGEAFDGFVSATASFKSTTELSFGSSFLTSFTETSSRETARAYEDSLLNTVEGTDGANVSREVQGAAIKTGVMLKSSGDVAFTIKNLQLTALLQDPLNPAILTPVATLVPDSGAATEFNLGPLAPQRGPISFSSTQAFPQTVESLMRNPRGLVLRYSNYDITDESGRVFSFVSQEINDRTASLIIDYGGTDSDSDGRGDLTDLHRVATGTGRQLDTDDDGVPDGPTVVFDAAGKHVGITLRDALKGIGLNGLREEETASGSLSPAQQDSSYSTKMVTDSEGTPVERIYRIKRTRLVEGVAKQWEVLTPTGIDQSLGLDDHILRSGESFTLAFLADQDQDRVPALIEFIHGCADSVKQTLPDDPFLFDTADTDRDGLDDRFEIAVGWQVNTDRGSRQVTSRCSSADSDNDGLSDALEAPGVISRDTDGLVLFNAGRAPYVEANQPRRVSQGEDISVLLEDPITDPSSKDTDSDGLDDRFELKGEVETPDDLDGYQVKLLTRPLLNPDGTPVCPFTEVPVPPAAPWQTELLQTSPEQFDSDEDTASDGVEERVGGNPRCFDFDSFGDADGDGLVNIQETEGWTITTEGTSSGNCTFFNAKGDTSCGTGPQTERLVTSEPNIADTDGDGLNDFAEFKAASKLFGTETTIHSGSDPRNEDTDGDGLTDAHEINGFNLRNLGQVKTNPNDADTDDDKRSDGAEADRSTRMVVRVPGQDPYEAFSDPNHPDKDLDQLVDGDEQIHGADPAKANTDGDGAGDYAEVLRRTRPYVPERMITVQLSHLHIFNDCESSDNNGEFFFEIDVRKPAGNPAPLRERLVTSDLDDGSPFQLRDCQTIGGSDVDSYCRDGRTRIQLTNGAIFNLAPALQPVTLALSKTPSLHEEMILEGSVKEIDDGNDSAGQGIVLPDPLHLPEEEGTGIFASDDIDDGSQVVEIKRTPDEDSCSLALYVNLTAND